MREIPHPGALAHHFPEVSTEGALSAPGEWMANQALTCALLDTEAVGVPTKLIPELLISSSLAPGVAIGSGKEGREGMSQVKQIEPCHWGPGDRRTSSHYQALAVDPGSYPSFQSLFEIF